MTSDIYAYLVADTATHDVVGDKIYCVEAPQKPTKPYMTYFMTGDPHTEFAFNRLDAGQANMMVNVYSSNPYTALSIGNTIRGRLEQYGGVMGNTTVEYIRCGGTEVVLVPDHDFYQASFGALINYYGD